MIILAIDTAASQCAVALLLDSDNIIVRVKAEPRGQSERLMPMIMSILEEAKIGFTDLSGIAITTGPGSFTGLRVGLAAARGFALALKIPVVGIDSFSAFNAGIEKSAYTRLIVIESRRAELYWQAFDRDGCMITEAVSALPADIATRFSDEQVIIGGDGADHLRTILPAHRFISQTPGPDPAVIARLGQKMLETVIPLAFPKPFYVRPPDAKRNQL